MGIPDFKFFRHFKLQKFFLLFSFKISKSKEVFKWLVKKKTAGARGHTPAIPAGKETGMIMPRYKYNKSKIFCQEFWAIF